MADFRVHIYTMNSTRRDFLTGLTKFAGGAVLGASLPMTVVLPLIESCTPTSVPLLPENTTSAIGPDGSVSVSVSALSQGSPAFQVPNVIAPDGFGVMVTLTPDGTILAFSMRCTHQSCSVDSTLAHGDIHCACHGSLFALDGTVVQGPATAPLNSYAVTYDAASKVAKIQVIPK